VLYDYSLSKLISYPGNRAGDTYEVPAGVTLVEGCFAYAVQLREVILPVGISEIPSSVFTGCNELRRVNFPAGLRRIESHAFFRCHKLESVEFPVGLESIGVIAFRDCMLLESVVLPEGLLLLDEVCFKNCDCLRRVYIPSTLVEIGEMCFGGCHSLEHIEVSALNPVYSSVDGVLYNKSQTCLLLYPPSRKCDYYEILPTVVSLTERNFRYSSVVEVVIPARVRVIPDYAFEQCERLSGVHLPLGLIEIGSSAFSFCDRLQTIDIPSSVRVLRGGSFEDSPCEELAYLQVYGMPAGSVHRHRANNPDANVESEVVSLRLI
jgi:hypothetical protein